MRLVFSVSVAEQHPEQFDLAAFGAPALPPEEERRGGGDAAAQDLADAGAAPAERGRQVEGRGRGPSDGEVDGEAELVGREEDEHQPGLAPEDPAGRLQQRRIHQVGRPIFLFQSQVL